MALESLLSAKRKPAFVTPVTPRNPDEVTLKPLPILAVPLVTPVTPRNHETRNDARKASADASVTPVTLVTPQKCDSRNEAREADEANAAHSWLIHFADRDPLQVVTTPASTHAEMLALYPSAVAAEPLAPTKKRPPAPMTAGDQESIRAWLEQIGETDAATVAEVLRNCQQDDGARDYFVGLARKAAQKAKAD